MTHEKLKSMSPCQDGLQFAEKFDTLQAAWESCTNPNWMMWYLFESESDQLLAISAACARAVLPVFESVYPNDLRPRGAVEAVEKFLRDGAPLDPVRSTASAANAAADKAYAYAASANAVAAASAAANAADADPRLNVAEIIRSIVPTI